MTYARLCFCMPSRLVTSAVTSPASTPMSSESGRILASRSAVSSIDGIIGSNQGGAGGGEGGTGERGGEGGRWAGEREWEGDVFGEGGGGGRGEE